MVQLLTSYIVNQSSEIKESKVEGRELEGWMAFSSLGKTITQKSNCNRVASGSSFTTDYLPSRLVIGTRGSDLALWQSNTVGAMLRQSHPGLDISIEIIETKGDKVLDVALEKIGDKGLFTKELENALLKGRIDIAVHSLKDMQTVLPEGLTLGAITQRAAPEDALVASFGMTIADLPEGGILATGSLRRRAQLLALRPDLRIVDLRGNVPTRLQRYRDSNWDGIILARAGLERLGLAHTIAQVIPTDIMIPAVGQGALGVEIREGDEKVASILSPIDQPLTRMAVGAERAFLRRLEGGCQAPIAAHAKVSRDNISLTGLIASLDGKEIVHDTVFGTSGSEIGVRLAEELLEKGGRHILESIATGR